METLVNQFIPQFIPYLAGKEIEYVTKVIESGYYNEHERVREFEKKFAEFVGARYCITVTSGTIALYAAIMTALKVKELKHVRIPDYAGIFAANACLQAGAENISLVDVSTNGSFKINEKDSNCEVTIHSNGRLGDTLVVEDCCQAINHHTKDAVSCYSFASTKHLTTAGQGGAVCCDDSEIFDKLSRLKDHGRNDRQQGRPMSDNFEQWGTNFKFTEIQAAFGLAQLEKLQWRLDRLFKMNNLVREQLHNETKIKFIDPAPIWYIDLLVNDPQQVISYLYKFNIQARRFYKPLHEQPLYHHNLKYNTPITTELYNRGVWLPSTTNLTDEQLVFICDKIKEAV